MNEAGYIVAMVIGGALFSGVLVTALTAIYFGRGMRARGTFGRRHGECTVAGTLVIAGDDEKGRV